MWWSVRFLVIELCVANLLGPQVVLGEGECKFTYINDTELTIGPFGMILPEIEDITKPGEILLEAKTIDVVKIKSVSSTAVGGILYMEATLHDDHRLILSLSDSFIDYEKDQSSRRTSIKVIFQCTSNVDTEAKEFIVPIKDTNNNAPEFLQEHYEYTLPMPLPKGISLNTIGDIAARDIDLTNFKIDFSLDKNDPNVSGLSVSWSSSEASNWKIHYAHLVTTSVINFLEDVTFTLYATDMGIPKKTNTTKITIRVDQQNSILQFVRPLYIANLTNLKPDEANGLFIPFDGGEIRLGGGVDETVIYTIEDDLTDYKKNFAIVDSEDHSTVRLQLIDPPEKFFEESSVLLSLTAAKLGAKETTVLHIVLPNRVSSPSVTDSPGVINSTSSCENTDYVIAVVVLVILFLAAVGGLAATLIINHRIRNKTFAREPGSNNDHHDVPEMREVISNGSVSSCGSFRKSVAFNDTVEEIKIARL